MGKASKYAGALAAAAMVMTPMTPAFARSGWGTPGYGSGYGNGWRRYKRDDTGTVIAALLGVGIIAAVAASASSNSNKAKRDRDYPNRDYRTDDYRSDDSRYRDDPYYSSSRGYDSRATGTGYQSGTGAYAEEDAAVDACAMAARDEGSRGGLFAEVRDITGARRAGNGYTVTGTLEQRQSFRAGSGTPRGFSCSWANGQTSVRLS